MGGLLLIDLVFAGNGQFVPVKRELYLRTFVGKR